jgi:hypothetical protein
MVPGFVNQAECAECFEALTVAVTPCSTRLESIEAASQNSRIPE